MKGHLEELLIGGRPMTDLEIKQKEEIERLNNIIKRLEEYIRENCYDYDYETYSSLTTDEVIELVRILDKGE